MSTGLPGITRNSTKLNSITNSSVPARPEDLSTDVAAALRLRCVRPPRAPGAAETSATTTTITAIAAPQTQSGIASEPDAAPATVGALTGSITMYGYGRYPNTMYPSGGGVASTR